MTTKTKFPTLYKQTNLGKIQEWKISVSGNEITTVYGLSDGKHQTTTDLIKEGKNIGRSNATTPESQAAAQAQQEFDGKLKDGYQESKAVAAEFKNTLDAVEPMLAFPIEKKEKSVKYPGLCQPKLDGLRMICIVTNGKAQLWSRTQKQYNTLPHIVAEIESIYGDEKYLVLDGEAYNHNYKKDFNKITELVKRNEIHPDSKRIEYHVYDVVATGDYLTRTVPLGKMKGATYLKRVQTVTVNSREEIDACQATYVSEGYEGAMFRSMSASYEHKRSSGLLKVKSFADAEFKIVSVEEGNGKLMNKVGAFHCELNDGSGRTFKATPAVPEEEKERMWSMKKSYIGKFATVKYQNLTPDGVPRFPIWKSLRDGNE